MGKLQQNECKKEEKLLTINYTWTEATKIHKSCQKLAAHISADNNEKLESNFPLHTHSHTLTQEKGQQAMNILLLCVRVCLCV